MRRVKWLAPVMLFALIAGACSSNGGNNEPSNGASGASGNKIGRAHV